MLDTSHLSAGQGWNQLMGPWDESSVTTAGSRMCYHSEISGPVSRPHTQQPRSPVPFGKGVSTVVSGGATGAGGIVANRRTCRGPLGPLAD